MSELDLKFTFLRNIVFIRPVSTKLVSLLLNLNFSNITSNLTSYFSFFLRLFFTKLVLIFPSLVGVRFSHIKVGL